MKIYDLKYNARKPEGIENRTAHIIGGGMAGLAAAVYLVDDAHMPGENIVVYEAASVVGGSMDGTGDAVQGYLCRGERELEPYMECLWNICSKVPSLRNEGRTVLDDVWDFNYTDPIHSEYRVIHNQGKLVDIHDFTLDEETMQLVMKLVFMPETELEGMTMEEYFPESFFHSNLSIMPENFKFFFPGRCEYYKIKGDSLWILKDWPKQWANWKKMLSWKWSTKQ